MAAALVSSYFLCNTLIDTFESMSFEFLNPAGDEKNDFFNNINKTQSVDPQGGSLSFGGMNSNGFDDVDTVDAINNIFKGIKADGITQEEWNGLPNDEKTDLAKYGIDSLEDAESFLADYQNIKDAQEMNKLASDDYDNLSIVDLPNKSGISYIDMDKNGELNEGDINITEGGNFGKVYNESGTWSDPSSDNLSGDSDFKVNLARYEELQKKRNNL